MTTEWPADKIERRSVASLVPYARNARTHSAAQIAAVAASIKEWGWTSPALIDPEGTIIAGHCRVLAAQKLGLVDIPVMVATNWSEAQKRAYVIADNQLAVAGADWDKDLLRVEIDDLSGADFDIGLLGFEPGDLSALLGDEGVSIAGEQDGAASGGNDSEFLKWNKQRIPLASDEIEALDALASRYVEIFGLAHGFARWLAEGRHLA